MSLIRCPGCKLDTSDSLPHCPNCGAAIGGSGRRPLFDPYVSVERKASQAVQPARSSPEPRPFEVPPRQHDTPSGAGGSPQAAASKGIGVVPKAIGLVILLVVLALVPHGLPVLVLVAIWWSFSKLKKSGSKVPQAEALKILVSEVRRARSQGSAERPLDMLRRIEQQLKTPRA